MYTSHHLYSAGSDHPSYSNCPVSISVSKASNSFHIPGNSQDQPEDLQYQGIQHMTESTGHRHIDLGQDNPTGSPSSGNKSQAMQPQGIFGPHLEESTRIKKKRRTQFTAFQLDTLEATFSQSQYISPPRRQSLSQQLDLPEESVKNWFKNRRVKWRREQCQYMQPVPFAPVPYFHYYRHYYGHAPFPNNSMMMIHINDNCYTVNPDQWSGITL